jgi:hypothetical protein
LLLRAFAVFGESFSDDDYLSPTCSASAALVFLEERTNRMYKSTLSKTILFGLGPFLR